MTIEDTPAHMHGMARVQVVQVEQGTLCEDAIADRIRKVHSMASVPQVSLAWARSCPLWLVFVVAC